MQHYIKDTVQTTTTQKTHCNLTKIRGQREIEVKLKEETIEDLRLVLLKLSTKLFTKNTGKLSPALLLNSTLNLICKHLTITGLTESLLEHMNSNNSVKCCCQPHPPPQLYESHS